MTATTVTAARAWAPDVTGFAPLDAVPDALILLTSTVAGSVEGDEPSLRVPYVSDGTAELVAEGAVINVDDPDLDEVIVFTTKASKITKMSRELMAQAGSSKLIMTAMRRAVTMKANVAYLTQAAPTGGSTIPAGLLNITGITDGGTIGANLDAVVDAVAGIEATGGTATHVIASPSAWAAIAKKKTGTGSNASLLGAGTEATIRMVEGVPVLVTPAMPADGLLVVDSTAIVSAVGQVLVATSADAFFTADSIAARVTWRFGANVVDPARIVKLTTA